VALYPGGLRYNREWAYNRDEKIVQKHTNNDRSTLFRTLYKDKSCTAVHLRQEIRLEYLIDKRRLDATAHLVKDVHN
jgi:hypothetical protein